MKKSINRVFRKSKQICFIFLFFQTGFLFSQINEINFSDERIDSMYETTTDISNNPQYYIKGRPDGFWIVYSDTTKNRKVFEVLYSKKVAIFYKTYYRNGSIKDFVDFEDNIEIGWYSNGSISGSYNTPGHNCVFTSYYENGMVMENLIFLKDISERLIELNHCKWDTEGTLIMKEIKQ